MDTSGPSLDASLPQAFALDVRDMVIQYCADGIEAWRGAIVSNLPEDPSASRESVLSQIDEGSKALFGKLIDKVSSGALLFERVCTASVFQAPETASAPQLEPVDMPTLSTAGSSNESEEALLARIADMRAALKQTDQRCSALRREMQRVDKQISGSGDMSDYEAVARTMNGGKEAVLAISQTADTLQDMIERAARLRSQQRLQWPNGPDKQDQLAGIQNAAGTSLEAVSKLGRLLQA